MSETTPAPARVPVEERLFSLVLALVATERGLTKDEILATVQGYRQRYDDGGKNASLERQFERDKDDVRELGIPLETVVPPGEENNTQNLRYRIAKGAYDLPPDIAFTSEEITLLGLAATVWREGTLSGESQRALMKLRSLGVDSGDPVIGYAPRLRTREAAFEPLRQALERHTVVSFPYLKPGERASRVRTVAPLALVQHSGRWHLYAHDLDADATRTFLLSRIVRSPRTTGRVLEIPAEGRSHSEAALEGLDRVWASQTARVQVVPGSHAATALARVPGASAVAADVLEFHFLDINVLADEITSYGPDVLVLDPPALRAAVVQRLTRLYGAHREEQA